jgi:hypothetical protein
MSSHPGANVQSCDGLQMEVRSDRFFFFFVSPFFQQFVDLTLPFFFFFHSWPGWGQGPDQLSHPYGITAIDVAPGHGGSPNYGPLVVVADTGNNRVALFWLRDNSVSHIPCYGMPHAVTEAAGELVVLSESGIVYCMNLTGVISAILDPRTCGLGACGNFVGGVAVDNFGDYLVTDNRGRVDILTRGPPSALPPRPPRVRAPKESKQSRSYLFGRDSDDDDDFEKAAKHAKRVAQPLQHIKTVVKPDFDVCISGRAWGSKYVPGPFPYAERQPHEFDWTLTGIAVTASGRVWVGDRDRHRVCLFR